MKLGRSCRGFCVQYESHETLKGKKYYTGRKRCSHCELFLATTETRCPCCKSVLRTKARTGKRVHLTAL